MREREVPALVAEGRSNHAIANRLVVPDETVETHVRRILTKLDRLPVADDNHRVPVLAHLQHPSPHAG